jgi:hypothetical protein
VVGFGVGRELVGDFVSCLILWLCIPATGWMDGEGYGVERCVDGFLVLRVCILRWERGMERFAS